ncbi:gamma-glutamylcyclotransferase family protein [Halomonas sp. WWR20]
MTYYFAYGSNMNPERVAARIGATYRAMKGTLEGYRLSFNKASRVPGIAHANIMPQAGSRVEGVLYELMEDAQIRRMDPFEGHPRDYARELLPVQSVEGDIPAWVYIALPALTLPALKPAQEYLTHLLAGQPFLSSEYHARLMRVETVEGLCEDTLAMLGLSCHTPR